MVLEAYAQEAQSCGKGKIALLFFNPSISHREYHSTVPASTAMLLNTAAFLQSRFWKHHTVCLFETWPSFFVPQASPPLEA